MRLAAILCLTVSLGGCLDWQGTYTAEAQSQCREIINIDDRMACMRRVAENDYERRAERRLSSDGGEPGSEAVDR